LWHETVTTISTTELVRQIAIDDVWSALRLRS